MKIGILTRDEESWCSFQLKQAVAKKNGEPICFSFTDLTAKVGMKPEVALNRINVLDELDAIIVRPIGRGSLEEIVFRLDLLHRLEGVGMSVINSPSAIERSVDKYYALTFLEAAHLPVPRTVVMESAEKALEAFHELGGDVVAKPIFGSRGIGSTRISDPDVAERIFRALSFHHEVIYLQEFVPHGNSDLRIFVLGNRVLASMRRVAELWKTNVSLGASPKPYEPTSEIEELSLKASETIGCDIAGVDILETANGPLLIEINSQPGWKGLQTVTSVNIAEEIVNYVLTKVK